MKTDLVRPCANCPFRTDIVPFLTPGRVQQLEQELVGRQASFACHKTLDYERRGMHGELGADTKNTQHCAGAMILLEKIGRANQWMRWMERLGGYDMKKLDMGSPVYNSFDEMLDAHVDTARDRRRAARKRK